MEWTPRPLVEHLREQERHNVTVITVGSKYEVYVRSPAPSHMQTLKQPFQTLQIKWEVNIIVKKSSCVFLQAFSFLRPLFVRLSFIMRLLSLRRYVSSIYMYATKTPLSFNWSSTIWHSFLMFFHHFKTVGLIISIASQRWFLNLFRLLFTWD